MNPKETLQEVAAQSAGSLLSDCIISLLAENEELSKKAARYDYIRNNGQYVVKCGGESLHCGGHTNISHGKYPASMDAAIDERLAAMAKQGGE